MSVKVSDRAHEGWKSYTRGQGVTISGVVEAMGEVMAEGGSVPDRWDEIVGRARVIDSDRRGRRRP